MKKWLMKTYVIACGLLFLGCATTGAPDLEEWQPVCRHQAVLCAIVAQEHYSEVRIACGPGQCGDPRWHAQAKVKINGEWRWLRFVRDIDRVRIADQDCFKPLVDYGVKDFAENHMMRSPLR